jgi:hypothetical protein
MLIDYALMSLYFLILIGPCTSPIKKQSPSVRSGGKNPFNWQRHPTASTVTLAGRPIGNKKTKLAAIEAASSERVQSSIDKCLTDVTTNLFIRDEKSDERWKALLLKQKENNVIEERVIVKKRKDD